MVNDRNRLCHISIDLPDTSLAAQAEAERAIAIAELLESNVFELIGRDLGPYQLSLSRADTKVTIGVANSEGHRLVTHLISARPLRRMIKDYEQICNAHSISLGGATPPHRAEAIDMARRAIHNEGARFLADRIASKSHIDFDTARRLFTLIFVSMVSQ